MKYLGKAIASSMVLGVANFLYEFFTYSEWAHAFEITFMQTSAIFIFVYIWLSDEPS